MQNYNKDKELLTDIGFSSPTPYDSDLKHDTAALGLLQILFIDRYLPNSLLEMIKYSLESNIAFILIAFDISEISITSLRRKTLNKLIGKTNKPLETVFFLYAGCLLYWFSIHKSHQQIPSVINALTEKMAYKQPGVLIDLAKENFYLQSERL